MTPAPFTASNDFVAEANGNRMQILKDKGEVLSCWQMTWRERFSALCFGRAWLFVKSGIHPLVGLQVRKDILE